MLSEHRETNKQLSFLSNQDLKYAVRLVRDICRMVGVTSYINDARRDLRKHGVLTAIKQHDTAKLFNWLMTVFSYQGISNSVVYSYIQKHGQIKYADVSKRMNRAVACSKLNSYWDFSDCHYQKLSRVCAKPALIKHCPLPVHDLRNGRLNQIAYSLFLFLRDITGNDLIGWIDKQIENGSVSERSTNVIHRTLILPMRSIFGVSDKVLSMAIATLLIGGSTTNSRWFEIGSRVVVIDRLVHNFLHRAGILRRFRAEHTYGAICYESGFCVDIVDHISRNLDASEFNKYFPVFFPRFVQNSIWRFCGQTEANICNGTRIDDRSRCNNHSCELHDTCDRIRLN